MSDVQGCGELIIKLILVPGNLAILTKGNPLKTSEFSQNAWARMREVKKGVVEGGSGGLVLRGG